MAPQDDAGNGNLSARKRIGLAAASLLALGGIIAVIAYFASQGHGSSSAATQASKPSGESVMPMNVQTMADSAEPAFKIEPITETMNDMNSQVNNAKVDGTTKSADAGKGKTDGLLYGLKTGAATTGAAIGTNIVEGAAASNTKIGNTLSSGAPPSGNSILNVNNVNVPALANKAPGQSSCVAADYDELKDAIEEDACQFVQLTGTTYDMEDEIVVSRSVTITGNPQTMPTFVAEDAPRSFRVTAGAFLELRFVALVMSEGVIRDPLPWEGATSPKVIEIRGGSVLFEAGAVGGNFVNCFFYDDPDVAGGLQAALDQTFDQVTIRVYGGHVFAVNGNINFINCLIYDLTILYPLTNFLIIGGDVLNLAGTVNFIGVTWFEVTFFGVENGLGLFVANIAGVTNYLYNNFFEVNGVVMENCIGQAFTTVGGVQTYTVSAIDEFSGIVGYTGSGELTTLAGVQVLTGVGNQEGFGIGHSIGIGMEYTIGSGVDIHTGASMTEWNGLFFLAGLGELTFVGSGVFCATGSPMMEYVGIGSENGQAGSTFLGAGYASFIGSPQLEAVAISYVAMTGEYIAVDAGFLTWIGSPVLEFVAIEYGAAVIGSILYVGIGALVIGGSPVYEAYTDIVTKTTEFWVGGTCETEGHSSGSSSGGESSRTLQAAYDRLLYELPWFVVPVQGCDKIVGIYEKSFNGVSGGGSSGGESSRNLAAPADPNFALKEQRALADAAPSKKTGPTAHLPKEVRRHATNFIRQKEDRRLVDTPLPKTGLFAFDMHRHTNNWEASDLEGVVPRRWLEDAGRLKARMQEITGANAADTGADRPFLHVDSKVDGYCGICNVDGGSVTGDGLSTCDYKENCADLENPPNSVKAILGEDESKVDYDEHFLVLADLAPTTGADVESIDMGELQESIVTAIAHLQGAEDTDREAVIVNVYTGEADPFFGDMMPAPKRNLQANELFPKSHLFKMVAVATSRSTSDLISEAMMPQVAGQESPLAQAIKQAFQANTGVEIGHVGLEMDRELYIPAYNSDTLLKHDRRHLGTHSTMVIDPDRPAVPLSHLEYKRAYHILLENYPADTQINLRLMRFKENHADKAEEQVVLPVKSVKTSESGEALVKYVFDHGTVHPGEYYVQATFPDGHVAYSPSYVLSHEEAPRKLYGPFMVV